MSKQENTSFGVISGHSQLLHSSAFYANSITVYTYIEHLSPLTGFFSQGLFSPNTPTPPKCDSH